MPNNKRIVQRIQQLERLLDIEYDKFYDFEEQYTLLAASPARTSLRMIIEREVLPSIRNHETEIAKLLIEISESKQISNEEAENICSELINVVTDLKSKENDSFPSIILEKLDELQTKLNEPDKSSTAKLKASLPIIPSLISYDIEVDPKLFFSQIWRKIKSLFKKSIGI